MLIEGRHCEVAEEQDEDEDIINTQRLFDEIASEEGNCCLAVTISTGWDNLMPKEVNAQIEEQR